MSTPILACCNQACGVPTGCIPSVNWSLTLTPYPNQTWDEYDVTYNFPANLTPKNPDSVWISYTSEGDDYEVELLPNSVMQDFIDSGFAAGGSMSAGDPASAYYAKYTANNTITGGVGGEFYFTIKPQACNDEALYDVCWLLEVEWQPDDPAKPLLVTYGLVHHHPDGIYDGLIYANSTTVNRNVQADLVAAGTFEWQKIGTDLSGTSFGPTINSDAPSFYFHETYL